MCIRDRTYNLDNGTQVDTLLSNDSGVAFIVKTKEGTIYHAGDLNDWYWDCLLYTSVSQSRTRNIFRQQAEWEENILELFLQCI